jgi:hypothetical protein
MAIIRREQTELEEINLVMQQPNGFPNQTDSEILYNAGSRQITIQPKAPATSFDYYINGEKYTISSPQQLTHPDTTATYFFYWDSSNTLQFSTTVWDILVDVPISFVFYSTDFDGLGGNDGYHNEERHHSWRNPAAHLEFHEEIGTYIVSGFGISGYTLQPVSPTDADNTFALGTGTIADEDIRLSLPALSDGGPYTVYRRIGSGGPWQWDKTLTLPFYDGTTYIEWNEDIAGTWQLTEGATNKYYNYYVLKTTSLDGLFQTVIIPGQTEHASLLGAAGENLAELDLGTLPFVEIAPLYKITFRTSAAYTSTGQCRIEAVERLVGSRVSITAASQSAHNSLSGLDYDTAGHGTGFTGFQRGTTLNAADPTINEDADDGYVVGDLWVNTTSTEAFRCFDSTVGAAVWTAIGDPSAHLWDDEIADLVPKNTRNLRVEEDQSYFIGADTPGLDQSQVGGSNTTTSTDVYQTITSGVTGNLVQVDLNFTQVQTSTTIRIYDGDGTGGTLLSTVPASAYPTGWSLITLPTPPYILSGTVFTVRVSSGSSLYLRFNLSGGYSGGYFSANPSADAMFRTYVLQTLYAAWKEGVAIVGDFNLIAQNNSGTSTTKIYNDAAGQVTELELNEGATKILEFSDDTAETGDLDKKLWTIDAIKKHTQVTPYWQAAIIDKVDFTTSEPGSPSVGDRYINTVTGTSSGTAQSVTANYIYEWNGTTWTETIVAAGYALWDITAIEYFSFNGTAWVPFDDALSILDLGSYVSVSQSGDNTFSAKNVDKPIKSLTSAMTKASALSPGFTNPILVDVLDGNDYIYGASGITIPSYVKLFMKGSTFNGSDIKLNDYSTSNIHIHSVSTMGYLKSSGSNTAYVTVPERLFVGSAEGLRCTSGRIDSSFKTVDITSGNLVAQFCSEDVNIDVSGKITTTSTGVLGYHDDDGIVNLRLNDFESAADGYSLTAGSGWNTITANKFKVAGQAFDVNNAGKYLSGIFCEVEEVLKSDTTYMNHLTVTYRRSGDSHNNHMLLRNMDGIVLDTPVIKAGTIQTFTNLGLTPVALTNVIVKNRTYKIIIEATDGRANNFSIDVGYNSGVPELVSAFIGGGATYAAPMGTITYTNLGGVIDQYNITISGFGINYNVRITRSNGSTTLSASSATTGTTTLQLIPIAGI